MEQNTGKPGAKRLPVIAFTVALTQGTPTRPYYNFAARGVHEHLTLLAETARQELLGLLVDARSGTPGSILYTYPVWKQPMRLNVAQEGEIVKIITRLEDEGTLSIGHKFAASVVDAWIEELSAPAAPAPAPSDWNVPDDLLEQEAEAQLRSEADMDDPGSREVYYREVVAPLHEEFARDFADDLGPAEPEADESCGADLHFRDFSSKEIIGYGNVRGDKLSVTLLAPFDRCFVEMNRGASMDAELFSRGFYAHARDAGDAGRFALSAKMAQSGRCMVAYFKRGTFTPAEDGKVHITAYWRKGAAAAA
ncbi:hypothetical protein [Deinococcus soli (ex Cha et al. 2016)]|uniref:Uncharacterized protein n=2 Tax=Deinococcus soli (ex Cha et al. 2016) TaxID=1309411 RepID=A0ACC6KFP4_9DEIO|nr:hypothetical protein [Deinococcus soli (ex Cha et al. 2016)]MDR6218276.1 hypothetical protein [Deinococcus soli (ex Cha et al. 2016)]MDR6329016.1 hypothetical protein [Deinococcus soli (ex Cha et al. 2016)]MDR6751289.1 hypothetical protein [Deinococcus soli (ex Cha et al. 2016)]